MDETKRPCDGRNANVCVAEGCYGEACIRTPPPPTPMEPDADETLAGSCECGRAPDPGICACSNPGHSHCACMHKDTPEPAPVGDVETWYETPGDAEYPDVLHDDVPVRVDWWWTEEGRAKHLAAFAAAQRAEAWDEGHRTPRLTDLSAPPCRCSAYCEHECACGNYGATTPAPNPYRGEARP